MLKQTLNKGISTPIAIGIILFLVILVGGFTWLQYGEMWRERDELPELELPEKEKCSKEEDCILRDVVVNEPCPPCDNSNPEYQCVSIEEAKRIHEEQKEAYGILPCAPCPQESMGDKRFKCICEGKECLKVEDEIAEEAEEIRINSPESQKEISSPLTVTGEARGTWYFEANFPVILTDWDGKIIAETYVQAEKDWMTENFVPFTSIVEFESPYKEGDPDFMKNGNLIFQKANPSGLSENDDALEIPIRFK